MDEKLLEALTGRSREKRGMTPEEAMEYADLIRKLNAIDLDKVQDEKRAALSPMERLVADLGENKDVARRLKGKRKKTHWKKAKRLKREYDRTRYREVLKPQRKKELAEKLTTAEGWWEYLNRNWRWLKTPVTMTQEEWTEVVWPRLNGRVPVFFRYNTKEPISLANIVVKCTETREVMFDGQEWDMIRMGYVLHSD
jgi:hypothetical protein